MLPLPQWVLAAAPAVAYGLVVMLPNKWKRLPTNIEIGLVAGLLVAMIATMRFHETGLDDAEGLWTLALLLVAGLSTLGWQIVPSAEGGASRARQASVAAMLVGLGGLSVVPGVPLVGVVTAASIIGLLAWDPYLSGRWRRLPWAWSLLPLLPALLPAALLRARVDQVAAAFAAGGLLALLVVTPHRPHPRGWMALALVTALVLVVSLWPRFPSF